MPKVFFLSHDQIADVTDIVPTTIFGNQWNYLEWKQDDANFILAETADEAVGIDNRLHDYRGDRAEIDEGQEPKVVELDERRRTIVLSQAANYKQWPGTFRHICI